MKSWNSFDHLEKTQFSDSRLHYFSCPFLWIKAFEWIPVTLMRFLRGSLFRPSVHRRERIPITLGFDRACFRARLALK